jgi:hypothetical protein
LGLNAALALTSRAYVGIFLLQSAFYAMAALGYLGNGRTRRYKFLLIPFYFVSMNVALLFGLFKALFAKDAGTWNRVERAARHASPGSQTLAYPQTSLQANDGYPN